MTLHTKILDAARDTVAREHDYADYLQIDMTDLEPSEKTELKLSILENATILAMEKQAEFYRWVSISYEYTREQQYEGVVWHDKGNIHYSKPLTEFELYEIWEGQK